MSASAWPKEVNRLATAVRWGAGIVILLSAALSVYVIRFNHIHVVQWADELNVSEMATDSANFAVGYWPTFVVYGLICLFLGVYVLRKSTTPMPLSIGMAFLAVFGVYLMAVVVISAAYELTGLPSAQ